jgi:hypothetical protein
LWPAKAHLPNERLILKSKTSFKRFNFLQM